MNAFPSSTDDPRLTAYALGELEGAECEEIRRWVKHDAEAARTVEALRATGELMEAALADEPDLLPLPVIDAPQLKDSGRRVIPWVSGLGALAAALLIGGVILHAPGRVAPTRASARESRPTAKGAEQNTNLTPFALASKLPVDRPPPAPLLELPPTKMIEDAVARIPEVLPQVRGLASADVFGALDGRSAPAPMPAAGVSATAAAMTAQLTGASLAADTSTDTLGITPTAYAAKPNEKQYVYPDDPGFVIRAVPRSRISRSRLPSVGVLPQPAWPPFLPDTTLPFSGDASQQRLLLFEPGLRSNLEWMFTPDAVAFGDGSNTLLIGAAKSQVFRTNPEFLSAAEHPLAGVPLTMLPSRYENLARSIAAGNRPAHESVRVEDCVNAFAYDYAEPVGDAPLGVKIAVAAAPWAPSHRLVCLALKAAANAPTPRFHVEFNPAQVASYRFLRSGPMPELAANLHATTGGRDLRQGVTMLIEIVPATETMADQEHSSIALRYQSSTSVPPHANELLAVRVGLTAAASRTPTLDFPLVDAGLAYEQASADFKFASAAAAFGMILADVPQRGAMTLADVARWASAGVGADSGGQRTAFVALVRQAETSP